MLSWIIYVLSMSFCTYLLVTYLPNNLRIPIGLLILIVLITPANIEVGSDQLAPSLAIFFYDLIFQQVLSFRSLRPLVISLPLGFTSIILIMVIKRRFF